MNLLLMGKEMAQATGLSIKLVTITVLVTSSFMVSATVSYCGLIGFVGLVIPHLLRLSWDRTIGFLFRPVSWAVAPI